MLKTFPGSGSLHSGDRVVWLWHPLGNLYICITISSCYGSIYLALGLRETGGGLSTLCHSCRFACQQRVPKTFPVSGSLHSGYGVVCLWHPMVNLYIWLNISSCYGSIPLALGLIMSYCGLITLCQSCWFACEQRVLKTFAGSGYLHSENGVVWIWHPLEYLYVRPTISSCYGSIPLALGSIVRYVGLSTLCHNCGFACERRVPKTFPGPGFLHSEHGVVWLWHPLECLYVWLTISCCSQSLWRECWKWGIVVWALYIIVAVRLVSRRC